MSEPTSIEDRIWICSEGHRWKARVENQCPYDDCQSSTVKEWYPDWLDLPEGLVDLFADALSEEITFMGGSKESWEKMAKGVLTKAIKKATSSPYNPAEVTEEEIHLIDLVMMNQGFVGISRVEQVNAIIDQASFWKEMSKLLGSGLEAITKVKGLNETQKMRDIADDCLSQAAAEMGG